MPYKDPVQRAAYKARWNAGHREQLAARRKTPAGKAAKALADAKYRKKPEVQVVLREKKTTYYKQHCATIKARVAKWSTVNRDKAQGSVRLRLYGLTDADYRRLLFEQNVSCAICHCIVEDAATEEPQSLHVDHCHTSSKVRGLLCQDCNLGLGRFKDSLGLLRNAQQYLLDRG